MCVCLCVCLVLCEHIECNISFVCVFFCLQNYFSQFRVFKSACFRYKFKCHTVSYQIEKCKNPTVCFFFSLGVDKREKIWTVKFGDSVRHHRLVWRRKTEDVVIIWIVVSSDFLCWDSIRDLKQCFYNDWKWNEDGPLVFFLRRLQKHFSLSARCSLQSHLRLCVQVFFSSSFRARKMLLTVKSALRPPHHEEVTEHKGQHHKICTQCCRHYLTLIKIF